MRRELPRVVPLHVDADEFRLRDELIRMIENHYRSEPFPFGHIARTGVLRPWLYLKKKESIPECKKTEINLRVSRFVSLTLEMDQLIKKNNGKIKKTMLGKFHCWLLFDRLCKSSLDEVAWYLKRAKTNLEEEVKKAKLGDLKALDFLIAFDPAWLYEPWVKEKFLDALTRQDRHFFSRFGASIANQKSKYFRRVSRNEKIVDFLKHEIEPFGFGYVVMPIVAKRKYKTKKSVADYLEDLEMFSADSGRPNPRVFKKLMRRHGLFSRPTAHGSIAKKYPRYGSESMGRDCNAIICFIDKHFVELQAAHNKSKLIFPDKS